MNYEVCLPDRALAKAGTMNYEVCLPDGALAKAETMKYEFCVLEYRFYLINRICVFVNY